MALYRDEVLRVSLRQVRAQFSPRVFSEIGEVRVHAAGVSASVAVVTVASGSARGGMRRWLRCPRCGLKTSVVGLVRNEPGQYWACARTTCGGWVSRRGKRNNAEVPPAGTIAPSAS